MIFCFVAFVFESDEPKNKFAGIQIQCIFMLNIFVTIYFGKYKPKNTKLQNRIELMNELLIQLVSVHMFLFTDFILDEDLKFAIGFIMVSFIGVLLIFNLAFILYFGYQALNLIYRKYKNLYDFKYNSNAETDHISISEEYESS